MVAYNFQRVFAPKIRQRIKQQTIRGHRRRHARPGEPLQLYEGMRTRHCRKIISDPICSGIDEVRFDLRCLAGVDEVPANNEAIVALLTDVTLEVNGIPLSALERDRLAYHDGFHGLFRFRGTGVDLWPFVGMVCFWMRNHGPVCFEGVLLRWTPAP